MNRRFYLLLAILLGMTRIESGATLTEVASAVFGGIKGDVQATAWLLADETQYLAYVGYDQDDDNDKTVRLGSFDSLTNTFTFLKEKRFSGSGSLPHAAAWLDLGTEGSYLAVGGYNKDNGNEIALFRFLASDDNSFQREYRRDFNDSRANLYATAWVSVGDTHYVIFGGDDDNRGKEARMYRLDISEPSDPTLVELPGATAEFTHGMVRSAHFITVGDDIYLALGGNEIADEPSEIKIYEFDPILETLTLITTESMNGGSAHSVRWHSDGETTYLAVGGYDANETAEIRVFEFNGLALTPAGAASFDNGVVNSLSWGEIGTDMYIVVGGDDGTNTAEVRVYFFSGAALIDTDASASFNNGRVYSAEFHDIDDTLYVAVGGDDLEFENKALRIYEFTPVVV